MTKGYQSEDRQGVAGTIKDMMDVGFRCKADYGQGTGKKGLSDNVINLVLCLL